MTIEVMSCKNKYPEIMRFCEDNYPHHRATLIESECSDTAIVYLHNPEHNWLSGCKIVYWNSWYPSEFNVSDLKAVDK